MTVKIKLSLIKKICDMQEFFICEKCGNEYVGMPTELVLTNPPPKRTSIMQFFVAKHLPPHLKKVSELFCELAEKIEKGLPCNWEKTKALDKLMEAKDCAVRAMLFKEEE